MKIFPGPKTAKNIEEKNSNSTISPIKGEKANNRRNIKKLAPPVKEFNESEVRKKLATHVETSDASKKMAIVQSKKLGEGFLNEGPALNNSDISKNDPRDTNTQEKLKAILSKGAFSFNGKEKEALEKILS